MSLLKKLRRRIHESAVHVHKAHYEKAEAVRTGDRLTFGERAADVVRNGMGSWSFIIGFIAFMAVWVGVNTLLYAFDAYPFILLNLMLSSMAGLQAGILLVAAKRSDRISSEVALHTVDNTEVIKQLLEQNTELTKLVEQLTREVRDHMFDAGERAA